jgi:hypothetical protein
VYDFNSYFTDIGGYPGLLVVHNVLSVLSMHKNIVTLVQSWTFRDDTF